MREIKCLAVAALALFLAANAGAKGRSDAWITTKVKATLAGHKNVSAVGTNVDTKNGVVTLSGEVDTQAEKELAGRYVREVDGVRSVNNRLIVKGDGDRDDSGILDDRDDRDDRDDDSVRDSSREGIGDRALHKIGDAALGSRVKAALAGNRGTSAIRTNVDTERGAVTLHGTAKSDAEKDLAEKLVREVDGVKSVDNRIDVR
ncbi:MAG: BON domain-containing protein [Elusimicrobiota bacterium]|nr:MAG: BON domain-containing protein [Elusimicrobiota bacterium]